MTANPAGWQPDPTGRHEYRFFNGRDWTEFVIDAGVRTTDPYDPTTPAPPPVTRSVSGWTAPSASSVPLRRRADRPPTLLASAAAGAPARPTPPSRPAPTPPATAPPASQRSLLIVVAATLLVVVIAFFAFGGDESDRAPTGATSSSLPDD